VPPPPTKQPVFIEDSDDDIVIAWNAWLAEKEAAENPQTVEEPP